MSAARSAPRRAVALGTPGDAPIAPICGPESGKPRTEPSWYPDPERDYAARGLLESCVSLTYYPAPAKAGPTGR